MTYNLVKFLEATEEYFKYSSETDFTQIHQFIELVKNNNAVLGSLSKAVWQPEISLNLNQVVKSPNMPENTVALVTAIGTTGQTEPTWTAVGTTLSDGGVTYLMLVDAPIPVTDKEIDNLFT